MTKIMSVIMGTLFILPGIFASNGGQPPIVRDEEVVIENTTLYKIMAPVMIYVTAVYIATNNSETV